ncbi:N-acetyltransferase [Pedobacter sp. B4-66]|uniref:GNAT family N-acetyltransferase n=1 Tax=Pedobacter sp. B4-66 TaxID=2817280 RepID=UPI001BDAC085|nr:N-acetyltransferase [Pedobacter sp. B4-66]
MDIKIRTEEKTDTNAVFHLIEQAFAKMEESDHKEQFLVERLRKSDAFVPELSIVCEFDRKIIGYVLLTKVKIIDEPHKETGSLALGPIAVLPEFQEKGIGGKLIRFAHLRAKDLGFSSIILLGHDKYYPKFGYKMLKNYGIRLPFSVPDENCLAIELVENALQGVNGTVKYATEFELG